MITTLMVSQILFLLTGSVLNVITIMYAKIFDDLYETNQLDINIFTYIGAFIFPWALYLVTCIFGGIYSIGEWKDKRNEQT